MHNSLPATCNLRARQTVKHASRLCCGNGRENLFHAFCYFLIIFSIMQGWITHILSQDISLEFFES